METLPRILDLNDLLKKKSFFLFGPRATGKSTLIKQQLTANTLVLDLLNSRLFLRLSASPYDLESLIDPKRHRVVVIDEIQRIPELLNEAHRLIEDKGMTFLLAGSSARKLRRGNVNLLAGRAWNANLFPLTRNEIPDFQLDRYLRFGGMPTVYLSSDPEEELDAYVDVYLREEIASEGLVRNLPPFSRFLRTMALSNGRIINFTKLANDCQRPASTVTEYVKILEDTLIGFMLPAWTESNKRKALRTAKFYFFDTGVVHTLSGTRAVDRNSDLYGMSFKQFIGMELRAYLSYKRIKLPLMYWRSTHGLEVDFLIGDHVAIEVKSSEHVSRSDLKGLRALQEENVFRSYYLVSQDPIPAVHHGIKCVHYTEFLEGLDALFEVNETV